MIQMFTAIFLVLGAERSPFKNCLTDSLDVSPNTYTGRRFKLNGMSHNNNYLPCELKYGMEVCKKHSAPSEAAINKFNHNNRVDYEHRPRTYILY